MRRPSSLLLLAALVGGLAAQAVHAADHAADWSAGQAHDASHHGAHAPCVDGEAHALDCAVCAGLGHAIAPAGTAAAFGTDAARPATEATRGAGVDIAASPARGPPAVA